MATLVSRHHVVLPYRDFVAMSHHMTLLQRLIRESPRTVEETCQAYEQTAREMGEQATLSPRQLARWARGDVGMARPVAQRVAERFWGHSFSRLLGPAHIDGTEPADSGASDEVASVRRRPTRQPGRSSDPMSIGEFVIRTGQDSRDHAAVAAAGGVAGATLEQLHAEVRRLAHAYASTAPLVLLSELIRTRDLAYELLDQTGRPAQLAELYLVAGQVCGLAATTAFDLGYRDVAEDHGRAAWTYAEMLDHRALCAYARGVQATIAFWSGRPREGLRYVNSGLPYAVGPAAVRLHAIGARASALVEDGAHKAREALRLATEIADRNGPGDEMTDEIGGEFAFGRPRFALCAGAVQVTLGDGRSGARSASEALELYRHLATDERRWAVEYGAWMDLATARILQDDLEGAAEALTPALSLDQQRRTARLAQRLVTLRASVGQARYRDSPTARHIADAIDDFTSGSLVHARQLALPAGS
jgi:hypothetical protein